MTGVLNGKESRQTVPTPAQRRRMGGPRAASAQPAPPPNLVPRQGDGPLRDARDVDWHQIIPDPDQPRTQMDPERLGELKESIVAQGILQPLVVREDELQPDGKMRYIIVAGGRRHAALGLALAEASDDETRGRLTRVPIVLNRSAASERRIIQLIENIQREDLSPIDEARALDEIRHLEGLSLEGLAARVHRSKGYVHERLRLLRHEEVEAALATGLLNKSAAAAVASLDSLEDRQAWLERARVGQRVQAADVYAHKENRLVRTPSRGARRSTTTSGPALEQGQAGNANTTPRGEMPPGPRQVQSNFDRGDDWGGAGQVPSRQAAGQSDVDRADGAVGTGDWVSYSAPPPVAVDRSQDETGVTDLVDRDAADIVRGVRALAHRNAVLDEVSLRLLREAATELTAFLASRIP